MRVLQQIMTNSKIGKRNIYNSAILFSLSLSRWCVSIHRSVTISSFVYLPVQCFKEDLKVVVSVIGLLTKQAAEKHKTNLSGTRSIVDVTFSHALLNTELWPAPYFILLFWSTLTASY